MAIVEVERLSRLIGGIYDAAVDSSLWSAALERIADFVGGCSVALISRDAATPTIEVHHHFGPDADLRQLFRHGIAERDPVLAGAIDAAADQTICVADVMPRARFLESRFYREWAAPQGAVDSAAVVIERSDTRMTLLSVLRRADQGVVDEVTRERLRLLAPHIRQSTIMTRKIEAESRAATGLADAIDVLSTAICLLDGEGRVVRANAACRRLFADADLITAIGGRIVIRGTSADRMLHGLLGKEDDETTMGVHDEVEFLTSTRGSHYLVRAVVLGRARRQSGTATAAATSALFVQKASIATATAANLAAKAFRLTPSESRVLVAIIEIGGVPEVAKAFGVAETTVKTHLSRLFEKMGVSRQADLMKIVARFSVPFARSGDRE